MRRIAVDDAESVKRLFSILAVVVFCAAGAPDAAADASADFSWPLSPRPDIAATFDPPEFDWLPGHRGVDLSGTEGQSVLAAGDGVVVHAGLVAGKPVVSIDHSNGLRTTYEPVVASVAAGDRVARGDVVGTLTAGHGACSPACLHWGVRRGREYLDPLRLVRPTPIRLKPFQPS
nr:M23 family metallopeptidase [Rhodococcus yunnanensis]